MKKILIVDNNRYIVDMLSKSLSEAGYKTIKAYDGMEAMDNLEKEIPDLIVLDLIMPKIDGYRLTKYLKNHSRYCDIPVIILSGVALEDKTQLFEVEADAFIAKGKSEDTILNLMTTIKWLETKKKPKKHILGMEGLHPREMTKELLLVKEHFDSMLQLMGEGVLEMDEQHRVFFANKAACQLLGTNETEIFGKKIQTIFPDVPNLDPYLETLPATYKKQKPGINLSINDKTYRLMATPFFFNQAYIGSIAVLEDITSQIKKEQALEELTSAIINNAPIGICILDNSHRIILANNYFRKLSYTKGNIDRKHFLRLAAFRAKTFAQFISNLYSAGPDSPISQEINFTPDRGDKNKTYLFTVSALIQQKGLPYYLILVEDITKKAELEKELIDSNRELEIANKAKNNFLSIISHELRTPLSVIRGYINLILEGKIQGARGEALEALQTSDRRARHLQELIEELLDISRTETGKITLKEDLINLKKHIDEIVEILQSDIKRKKLHLKLDLPDALPEVIADHDKIHQVFNNLINNAIKFTPNGGKISITGEASDHRVKISIKDTGVGIPADKIPFIYDKFYQVDSTDTRTYGGSGLGLSVVRMILEASGGEISVKSRVGVGTTFTVFLPMGPAEKLTDEEKKAAAGKAQIVETKRQKKNILVCKDDTDTLKILKYALSDPHHEIIICRDSFKALEKAYSGKIDLIIADIGSIGMDGYDLCRVLRACKVTAKIPIIIISAAGLEEDIDKGYKAGANEYMIEPFNPKDLLEKVKKYLD